MKKYYTRACNFYYGEISKKLVKKRITLPLSGNNSISFDKLEVYQRDKNKISSKIIKLKEIKFQNNLLKKKINQDLRKIISKKYYFNDVSLMGILNMTPDSFSDGGLFKNKKNAMKRIKQMIKAGAKIIDIGGESTRPGSLTVNSSKEWKRISSVIKQFKKKFPKVLLSVDTRKSLVMKNAIKYKADIINDVSGFEFDSFSINTVSKKDVWKIIHHMQGTPQTMQNNPKYVNVLLDIYDFFEKKLRYLTKYSNQKKKFILDPGIGFGKNLKHNLILINNISLFHSLGFPILIGTSRKRFINQISGEYDTDERIGGTLSSIIYLLSQGVQIFRVHNVEEVKQGLLVYKKILGI
tara:strand:+ start:1908 stop:2963 length:1056 start_codon:yes stop_codon:yes gene_type:complete